MNTIAINPNSSQPLPEPQELAELDSSEAPTAQETGTRLAERAASEMRLDAPIAILGVPFDRVTMPEALESIEHMVASQHPHYVVTANVDFLVQAQSDVELRRILCDADLVLCDGTPLVWASRLLGDPLPERVAGSDLVPLLIRVAEAKGYRLFFLGATTESANQAVANLRRRFPDLIIAGHYSPPFRPLVEMDHEQIKRRILEAKPDILFVSFGCPKQEKWLAMHYRSLGVAVSIGVGATIDFLADKVKRAPVWMQRSGTEWIFRLGQEPRRLFRRYLRGVWVFGWKIASQCCRLGIRRPRDLTGHTPRAQVHAEARWHEISLADRLDSETAQELGSLLAVTVSQRQHCFLKLTEIVRIDSAGIGLLLRLRKQLRDAGRELILIAPSTAARQALALLNLLELFPFASDFKAGAQMIARERPKLGFDFTANEVSRANGIVWHGEITAANADAVWSATKRRLKQAGAREQITIDMTGVRYIDSSGLVVMVRARRTADAGTVKLAFTGLQPPVLNVLHVAKLAKTLLIEE